MTKKILLIVVGLCVAICADARAQAPQPATPNASTGLEEVVVTSRRREESIESVPDTIQAITAESIEQAGIRSINDVTRQIASFTLVEAQQPGVVLINIRGVGQVRNGEAPVAVVIDGVQQNSPNQITQQLYDVERIEVLKGPQGALYGRNAIGGAINVVTRAPTDELSGHIELTAAEGNEHAAQASVSGPIIEDKLLFRVSGRYEDRDGQITNTTLDRKVDFNEAWNTRANLLFKASERLTLDLRGWLQRQDAGASYYVPGAVNANPTAVIGNLLGQGGRDLDDYSLKVEYATDSIVFTSVSAYSKVESALFEELDWLPLDLLSATQVLDTRAWSQEFRLASASSSGRKWTTGLYYLQTDRDLDTEIFLRSDLTGIPVPVPLPPTRSTDDNTAWAAFGQIDQPIAERWTLTGAVRYDVDDRDQVDRAPPTPAASDRFRKKFTSFQPKASLAYTAAGGTLGYLTVAKGFRSGGFNANAVVTRQFDKEELWNYELGFKTALADRRALLSGAVFYTDITDRQVYGLDLSVGPNQFIANPIPKSHVVGAEIELATRPTPQLDLSLALGVLDTRIDEYDASVFANTLASGDFKGNSLNQTPSYTVNAAAQYVWSLAGGASVRVRTDVSGSGGDYYWEIDNQDKRDAVWLVDLRLAFARGPLTLTAYARNLFDERYEMEFVPVEFSAAVSGDIGAPSLPRQLGVQARWDF